MLVFAPLCLATATAMPNNTHAVSPALVKLARVHALLPGLRVIEREGRCQWSKKGRGDEARKEGRSITDGGVERR